MGKKEEAKTVYEKLVEEHGKKKIHYQVLRKLELTYEVWEIVF